MSQYEEGQQSCLLEITWAGKQKVQLQSRGGGGGVEEDVLQR